MYKIVVGKSFVKEFKKLPKGVKEQVLQKWLPKLQLDPNLGNRFKGKQWHDFWRLKFRFNKTDYRLVYTVKKKKLIITLIAVGSRENFYRRFR